MQQGMLFHYLKEPESNHYFEQLSLDTAGEIDLTCFEQAWNFVIETNEMLRTIFRWEEVENPIQIILKEHQLQPIYYDFSGKEHSEKKKQLGEIKDEDKKKKFDLQKVPFRVTLCKVDKEKYEIIISNHHILYDGWSSGIILKEFVNAYDDLSNGRKPIKKIKTKFKEYVKWIQTPDTEIARQEKFWRSYLKSFDSRTELSIKKRKWNREIVEIEDIEEAGNYRVRFDKNMTYKLKDFVNKNKITLAALLYTAWGILLQKYNNCSDVIFGTTVAGRSAKIPGIEDIVGLFTNTLPLRVQTYTNETAGQLLKRVHDTLQIREEYEATSLVKVKQYSEPDNKDEMFDSIMVVDNYPLDNILLQKSKPITVNSYSMFERSNYDLTVGIALLQDINAKFNYNMKLFDKEIIVRFFHHFMNIFPDIISNPGKRVSQLEILTVKEKRQLVYDFNDTRVQYPVEITIHERFEQQVENTPDTTALVFENERFLTYKHLNRLANRLAHRLRAVRVKGNNIAGIIGEYSFEMVIGLMAILKAGNAYASISPDYPPIRVEYILADTNTNSLLTQIDFKNRFPGIQFKGEVIEISDKSQYIKRGRADNPENINVPHHLAYILYTSGSTGTPKGVMVEHRNVINLLSWFGKNYRLKTGSRVLQLTGYTFDPHVEDIFGTLFFGGTLYVVGKESLANMGELRQYIQRQQINLIDGVPGLLKELLCQGHRLNSLDIVITGGERLDNALENDLLHRGYTLFNHYGLLETTVDSLVSRCSTTADPPVFRPLANTAAYIIDQDENLLPVGAVGELALGGDSLSRGYLNQPALTADKFCLRRVRTFLKKGSDTSKNFLLSDRLFKTGDLAKLYPGGNIEILDRIDNQVKIRGSRIEPGEIEKVLINHRDVKETVVTAKDDGYGNKYLCSYVVLQPNRLKSNGDTYDIRTAAQMPSFKDKIEAIHQDSWPAFFIGSEVNRTYWKQLYQLFPDFQVGIADETGNIAAAGNSIPIHWNGKKPDLPGGWDDAVVKGFETGRDRGKTARPNTLCVLAGIVNKKFKSKGMSYEIIKTMKMIAREKGFQYVIIPVRLTQKEQFPYMSLEEYCRKTRSDGLPFDPWLRVHLRLQGEIIGYCHFSQRVTGTVREWETWTGRTFEKSGRYLIKGAMQPVEINVGKDCGIYDDLAVWVRHQPAEKTGNPLNLLNSKDIRDYLSTVLPYYMVPVKVMFLDKIPLTPHGKIDRKALPAPGAETRADFAAPGDDVERTLTLIWADILGMESKKIGINDDFFLLGGHSLKATGMVFHIQKALRVKVPVPMIFKNPTIKGLAHYIHSGKGEKEKYAALEPADEKTYYALSPQQKRMYVLQQMEKGNITYNGPQMVILEGFFDRMKVEKIFMKLIKRHESLRTSIVLVGDKPFQEIHGQVDFAIEYFETDAKSAHPLVENFIRPFDLGQPPLMRVRLVKVEQNKHILMVDLHHIISDGTSREIFIKDFRALYEGKPLPPLRIRYKDYSEWRGSRDEAMKERERKQEKFWLAQFQEGVPVLDLPADYQRPAIRSFKGDIVTFTIPPKDTKALNALASEEKATLFILLLAIYNIFLSRLSGQEDIVIGTPAAGRNHKDLDSIIGMFVNTLALRNYPKRESTFKEFLRDVKERVLNAFENQDYQFENLVDKAAGTRSSNRTPLFDVMVALQNMDAWNGEIPGLKIIHHHNYRFHHRISKFDMVFIMELIDNHLAVEWEYSTELFKRESIEIFVDYFKQIVSAVLENPGIKLEDIKITGDWFDQELILSPIDFGF